MRLEPATPRSRVKHSTTESLRSLRGFVNNKGADQPAHPCSLISAFLICLLESIISIICTSRISLFYLVSVTEQAGLSLALRETPKTDFVAARPK